MAQINLTKPKKQRFPVWTLVVAVVLCLCIAAALLWQPVLVRCFPGAALTLAAANSLGQVMDRLRSPLADAVVQASAYAANGSLDAELTAGMVGFTYRSDCDPANRRQSSSYTISMMGLSTGSSTYLDADCTAVSTDLLTGTSYYGITFDSFEQDLEKTGFAQIVAQDRLNRFRSYVAYLDSVYPDESRGRSAGPELPDTDASDWTRTLQAYLEVLEFESSQGQYDQRSCDVITAEIEVAHAAQMALDVLNTLGTQMVMNNSLYSDTDTEAYPALAEKLQYYRDYTEGTVTFAGYILEGKLVTVELSWTFTKNNGTLAIAQREQQIVNLGRNPGQGIWSVTLEEEKAGLVTSDEYILQAEGSICSYSLTTIHKEGNVRTETGLTTRWDESSGLLTLDMFKRAGGKEYTASTSGILERAEGSVRCTVSNLGDFFQLLTLPDFLKEYGLDLIPSATVSLEFTDTPSVTKPEFINLDQWKLSLLLDLFI